jgi:hypothetical protein
MNKLILLAALAFVIAAGAATAVLTVTPQTAIAGPCDNNGFCCSGRC